MIQQPGFGARTIAKVKLGNISISFARGETIHTENSYKYTVESFQEIAQSAGFDIRAGWSDERQLFGVYYLELQN